MLCIWGIFAGIGGLGREYVPIWGLPPAALDRHLRRTLAETAQFFPVKLTVLVLSRVYHTQAIAIYERHEVREFGF
jgi:hypothetical protein